MFDRNAWTYVWEPNVQYRNYHNLSEYKREENFGKRDVNGLIINGTSDDDNITGDVNNDTLKGLGGNPPLIVGMGMTLLI